MREIEITFVLTMLVIIGISLYEGKGKNDAKAIQTNRSLFKTDPVFNITSFVIMTIFAVIYIMFK